MTSRKTARFEENGLEGLLLKPEMGMAAEGPAGVGCQGLIVAGATLPVFAEAS